MCDPASVMMALSVTSGVMDFIGGRQDAAQQNAAIWQNYNQQSQDIAAQVGEINQQAADDKSEIAIEALKERARVRAASGEAIGLGNTASMLLQDVYAQEGRNLTKVEQNRRSRIKQVGRQQQSLYSQAASRSNSIESPSLIGLGLSIGSSVAGYKANQPSRPRVDTQTRNT